MGREFSLLLFLTVGSFLHFCRFDASHGTPMAVQGLWFSPGVGTIVGSSVLCRFCAFPPPPQKTFDSLGS